MPLCGRPWPSTVRRRCAAPPLPASAAEQVTREAAAEQEIRTFYERGGFLSQPDSLRHYLTAEVPAYLAPLRFLGVLDDLTDEFRLDSNGVSYVLPPSPELPYFYAANARDPRAGIVHEGAHYQQLALSNAHPNPLRRRYYDSGAERGDRLLQRGVPPAGRAVRRRPAHAGGDLELRPLTGAARRSRRPPRHWDDEPRRRGRLLRPPGADGPPDGVRGIVLLRRQPGPCPVVPDGQAATDQPRRRGRPRATATTSRCAGSTTPSGSMAMSRSRCCAGSCSATARCSTPSMPIRRPERRRPCRRGSADARRGQAAELRSAAGRIGHPAHGGRAGGEWLRLAVGERPRRDAGDGDVAVSLRR